MFEKVTRSLEKVYATLTSAGYECYLVGGSVRNFLCGEIGTSDFDITTDARPEQVIALFRRVIPTGIKHGTVTVFVGHERFEVTTYRLDGEYSDGRRPDQIRFISGILEDLKRRDFTMNSVAYELGSRAFLDPNHGIEDIKERIIRAIGSPVQRFQEDGLRPLRAIRFVSQLGFSIEQATYEAISVCVPITCKVSKERIAAEIFYLCEGKNIIRSLLLMRNSGLLDALFPEMSAAYSFQSRQQESLYLYFLTYVFKKINPNDLELRLATVFSLDATYFNALSLPWQPKDHSHELRVARCLTTGRKYRFSTKVMKNVAHLVRWSTFPRGLIDWSDTQIRIFLQEVEPEYLERLFTLWYAVAGQDAERQKQIHDAQIRIHTLLSHPGLALSIKDLAIDGAKLMTSFSLGEGRTVGQILNILLDKVIEDPSLNQEITLLDIAQRLLK